MTEHDGLLVQMVTNGPFAENCYIVADATNRRGVLIDPGDEEERLVQLVRDLDVTIEQILCTHAHIDHAGAVAPLQRMLGVPFAVHPAEKPLIDHLPIAGQMFGLPTKEVPQIDRDLVEDETLQVGSHSCKVIFTPGHSPGGCCFYFADQKVVFVGDTLFAGSVGRTDLPGGDTQALLSSIKERLLCLDDDVIAYSGHGPETTIGAEKQHNPFLGAGGFSLF